MANSLLERFAEHKEQENKEHALRLKADFDKEEDDKRDIEYHLDRFDITDYWTNGYSYNFNYNGYHVSFVNQEGRFCYTYYKIPKTPEEQEMINELHILEHNNPVLADGIKREYDHVDNILNGPAAANIVSLMRKVTYR